MATKRPGEKYWGEELHIPISADGQVTAYVWPLRMLVIRGRGCGGPTIGIDVGNEEVVRFDCHAGQGHWHSGGYDKLGSPGNSQKRFPSEGLTIAEQIAWSLQQISERSKELLEEAEYSAAAQVVEPALVQSSIAAIKAHLDKHNGLRDQAVKENLIAT